MRLGKLGLLIVLTTTVTGMEVELSEKNEAMVVKAGDPPLEVTVLHSASFDMSAIGASSVNLRLDKIKGQRQLQLVARISSVGSGPLFSFPSCLPSIHLVKGQSQCSALPSAVHARLLAHLVSPGPGEVQANVFWEELNDSCLVVLRPKDCAQEEKKEGGKEGKWGWKEEEESESGDEGGSGNNRRDKAEEVEKTGHQGVDWDSLQLRRHPRRLIGSTGSLRAPSKALSRAAVPLSLASFTVLSAGATGAFLALNTASSVSLPYNGLVATKADPWSTWPLVQLPGLAASSAVVISLSMITLYLAYALLAGSPIRFTTVRRRVSPGRQGVVPPSPLVLPSLPEHFLSLIQREAVEKPRQLMQALAANIDRGLLRRRSPVHGKRRIDYIEHPFLLNKSSHLIDPKLFLERSLQNEDEVEPGSGQTEAKIEPRTTGEAAGRFLQPEQLLVTDLWKTIGDENR